MTFRYLNALSLVLGLILVGTSQTQEQNGCGSEEFGSNFEENYFYRDDGWQCFEHNSTRAQERNHYHDLLKLVASGTLSVAAAEGALLGLGFTSAGIAKGSFAAAWMSKLAIASGGGVMHGSSFAVLQSMGAAGLGPFLLPVALGGVAVGAGVMYRQDIYSFFTETDFKQSFKDFSDSAQSEGQKAVGYTLSQAENVKQSINEKLPLFREKAEDYANRAKESIKQNLPLIQEKGADYASKVKHVAQAGGEEAIKKANKFVYNTVNLVGDWFREINV